MATLDIRTHAGTTGLGARFADLFGRAAAALQRRALYRQTVRELGALSDRDLADLGINRSMITTIAADAVRPTRTA